MKEFHTTVQVRKYKDTPDLFLRIDLNDILAQYGLKSPMFRSFDVEEAGTGVVSMCVDEATSNDFAIKAFCKREKEVLTSNKQTHER